MQVDSRCSPRKFAQEFIKSLRERAEKVPNAGQRAGSGKVIKLGSDCTGLSSDFVALKFALGASVKLQTAFISDTWLAYYQLKFKFWCLMCLANFQLSFLVLTCQKNEGHLRDKKENVPASTCTFR